MEKENGTKCISNNNNNNGLENNNHPSQHHSTDRRYSYFHIAMVVAFYWTTSISMVFANKYLVGSHLQSTNDISIFVGWAQCTSTVLVITIIILIRRFLFSHDVTIPSLDKKIILNINFLGFIFVFINMLIFSNLCLRYVGIAFFQLARSCTLIFVVALSVVLLKQSATRGVIVSCLLIVAGFCLGVDQEKVSGSLSITGVLYGITSSLFIALNGIMSKRFLPLVRHSSLASVYYMNLGGAIGFIPFLLFSGQWTVVQQNHFNDHLFLILLFLSGVLSFLIGFASTLQIDVTSPTTHHISNNSKSVVQTIMAVAIFSEKKTLLWWGSNFLVIAGALTYVKVKMEEDKKNAIATTPPMTTTSTTSAAIVDKDDASQETIIQIYSDLTKTNNFDEKRDKE